jgi:hypothetical protein
VVLSRRALGLIGLIGVLCLVGCVGLVGVVGIAGLARASAEAGQAAAPIARPYQQGPLEARDFVVTRDLPHGAEELLGLSVLAAFLYGLRASGLARESERS